MSVSLHIPETIHFQVMSALLQYPEQDLLDALPELDRLLADSPDGLRLKLAPLLQYLSGLALIEAQENYVDTFDRGRKYSLHLFEHIHGESRDRGPAMVDLMEAYKQNGLQIEANELPDYLPLMLEFLGGVSPEIELSFLDEAVHVIAVIGERLAEKSSPYACVFSTLVSLASVKPLPLVQPPVRDMDEALETFGPNVEGVEPLLGKPGTQTVQFYPRQAARPAA